MFQPHLHNDAQAKTDLLAAYERATSTGWGKRRLNRFKVVGSRVFQLHATRGWKCIGRVKA